MATLALLAATSAPHPALAAPREEAIKGAEAMIRELGGELKNDLTAAMEAGGPAQAIQVCVSVGQEKAVAVAARHPGRIHRVSLKLRNRENRPNELERRLLENMEADNAVGNLQPTYTVPFSEKGDEYLLVMKPIVTAPVCLSCHGTAATLHPDAVAPLAEHYPDDEATGYEVGQVRGAFSVAYPLN
jgi:hypothetical protein